MRRRSQTEVLQFVRPAGVVEEVLRGSRYVEIPSFLDRLAIVQRLHNGKLAGPLGDRTRNPEQILAAFGTRHGGPDVLIRLTSGFDRSVDVGRIDCRDCGKSFTRPGIDGVAILAAAFLEAPVDEGQVAVLDIGNGTGLRRR